MALDAQEMMARMGEPRKDSQRMTDENTPPRIPPDRLRMLMGLAKSDKVPADDVLDRYEQARAKVILEPECFTLKLDIPRNAPAPTDYRIYRLTTLDIYRILRPDFDPSDLLEGEGPVTYCVVHDGGFYSLALEERGLWSWRTMPPLPIGELSPMTMTPEDFFKETLLERRKVFLGLEALAACGGHRVAFIGDPVYDFSPD